MTGCTARRSSLAAHRQAIETTLPARPRSRRLSGQVGSGVCIPSPTIHRIALQTWDWSSRNPFALLAAAIGFAALVVGGTPRPSRWKALFAIVWTIAPFLLTLGLSIVQPAFDSHYLLTAGAGLALLIGAGISALPQCASLILLALVAVVAGLQLAHYYIAPGRPFTSLF